ncbi:MAG: hypothetical protein ACK5LT_10315 [Lachnospirales bacterium]
MDLFALVAAFGGGLIGAYMGALPAFILTGVVALVGGVVSIAGGADLAIGAIAFGSYLGPHVSFAGGVAAAGYAAKRKKLSSGTDILSSLNGLQDPMTLVVGGVFGVIGFLLCYFYGSVLKLNTDLPGSVVVTSAIIVRLAFGTTGLFGEKPEGDRKFLTMGDGLICNILLGLGVGIATSFVYASLIKSGVDPALLGSYPVICFGIAAVSLVFAQTGFATPATHHIALISALAAVMSGSPIIGALFGVIAVLFGDFFAKTFNSNCDTHIDPPAFTIFTLTFALNLIFGTGLINS